MRFLIAFTFQFVIVAYELYVIACVVTFAIGAYIFAIASTIEIERNVDDFNNVLNDRPTSGNRAYILSQFAVFIYAHSTVKRLSKSF